MTLIRVAEPQTAEEVMALARRTQAAKFAPPTVVRPPGPPPEVSDALERRRQAAADAARREEAAWFEQASKKANELLERSGAYNRRRRAVAIVKQISEAHGIPVSTIMGPSRTAKVVKARFEAVDAVARAMPHWSLPTIGRFFGNRDHTTILNALRKMRSQRVSP